MPNSARKIQIVAFDCDSTLSSVEGINELAHRAGVGDVVSELTMQAMGGDVALEEVYGRRLEMIRPNGADLAWLGQRYCDTLVDGAREVFDKLRESGRDVHIVSGGIQQAVAAIALTLDVPMTNVHAVPVFLADDGSYEDFDTDAPLARTGGKPEILATLADSPEKIVLVGDGVFDLEARQSGVYVIGFGGVITRPAVQMGANAWIEEPTLLPVLEIIEKLES